MRAWNVPRAGAEVWLSDLPVPEVTEGTSRARACWPSPVTDGRVTWLRVATSEAGTALAASASHRRWLACSPAERRAFQLS